MTFSEFAQRMYPVIGDDSSTSAFTRTLLDAIVSYEDDLKTPLAKLKDSTFKSYYNGSNNITKAAKSINSHVETAAFEDFINNHSDNPVQALSKIFQDCIPDINPLNADQKLAELFESIIYEAAGAQRQAAKKKNAKETSTSSAHDEPAKKDLTSGDAITTVFSSVEETPATDKKIPRTPVLMPYPLSDDDKEVLHQFRKDTKEILQYCKDHSPAAEPIRVTLADEIEAVCQKWQYDMREIDNSTFGHLVFDITQTLAKYSYYLSPEFMQLRPGTDTIIFRNESIEEWDRLVNVLQPKTDELRNAISELYKRLYPIPEDIKNEDVDKVDTKVADEKASGAADVSGEGVLTQTISTPTIANQHDEKNITVDPVEQPRALIKNEPVKDELQVTAGADVTC